MAYDLNCRLVTYRAYEDIMYKICHNPKNIFSVYKEPSLGITRCGFDIEHYRIGDGPIRMVYAAGLHGNDFIGVDFIIDLMNNIALGNESFKEFDPNIYTIDFIPVLNPEGFFTATYAVDSVTNKMNFEDFNKFAAAFQKGATIDDKKVGAINACIRQAVFLNGQMPLEADKVINLFWRMSSNEDIKLDYLVDFITVNVKYDNATDVVLTTLSKWGFDSSFEVKPNRYRDLLFKGVELSCIPLLDDKHENLFNSISDLCKNESVTSLPLFNANSRGVNLSKNDTLSMQEVLSKRSINERLYGNLGLNKICISEPSLLGCPNYDMDADLELEPEVVALDNFVKSLGDEAYSFVYCGGTGNTAYSFIKENGQALYSGEKVIKNYVNNVNSNSLGKCVMHGGTYAKKDDGVDKTINDKFKIAMLLQLGVGAAPIGAYGDREKLFANIVSNMEATSRMMSDILEYRHINELDKSIGLSKAA